MQSDNKTKKSPVKFRFKNLGPVNEAELELGDLTIIAGRNNTGKTYLAYTLYGFLKAWKRWPGAEGYFLGESAPRTDANFNEWSAEGVIREAIAEGHAKRTVDQETLNHERKAVIRELARDFSAGFLPTVFSSPRAAFEDASIEVDLSADFPASRKLELPLRGSESLSIQYDGAEINMTCSMVEDDGTAELGLSYLSNLYLQFLLPEFSEHFSEQFILSAERFGISLFYRELDFTKNRLVDMLQKMGDDKGRESFSPFDLIESTTSRYALPIKDNIDFTRSIPDLHKERGDFFENKLFDDIKEMMEGYYRNSDDAIRFISKARKQRRFDIPLHRASSSARGLSDLYFFLRHVAKKNHLLIIDEPESHLDTANQIQLARLLARLVRADMKVLITTHSDYLIKEFNNLIMLSQSFENKNKIVKMLKYKKDDFLPPESIRAYVAEDNKLTPCFIDQYGIDMPVFDTTINDINRASNELASRLIVEDEDNSSDA